MSTPTNGYYDEGGNFVPGSFAEQLDLPAAPSTGSAKAASSKAALEKEQRRQNQLKVQIANATKQERALEQQLKGKLTLKQRVQLQTRLKATQQSLKTYQKYGTTSAAQVSKLRTQYYEASGQFEKLLTGANRDAYASLQALFNGYGLGTLAGKIYEYAKQGYGADTISLLLQNTKEYKERFAANTERTQKGLPVLSPGEYLGLEQSYRQIMQDAGLPKGFYDNVSDFKNWIAGDVSPTEVKGRVDLAALNLMQTNPTTLSALQQLYGIDKAHVTAYFLDQKRALPILQKQSQAAAFGSEALSRGLQLNKSDLEDWVGAGLSLGQVSQGFQAVAEALPNIQAIAARYGEKPFTQQELERDLVAGQSKALGETRRKRLASQERALFGGFGGATAQGLSTGFQAG